MKVLYEVRSMFFPFFLNLEACNSIVELEHGAAILVLANSIMGGMDIIQISMYVSNHQYEFLVIAFLDTTSHENEAAKQ